MKKYLNFVLVFMLFSVVNGNLLFAQNNQTDAQPSVATQMRNNLINDKINKISFIKKNEDEFLNSLIQEFEKVCKDFCIIEIKNKAENFYSSKIGASGFIPFTDKISGLREESLKKVYEDFFEQEIKGKEKIVFASLQEEMTNIADKIMKKYLDKYNENIREDLREQFSGYDKQVVDKLLDDIKTNTEKKVIFLNPTSDPNIKAGSIADFSTTIIASALVGVGRLLASNIVKSTIKGFVTRVVGKSFARSIATPGEWFGPAGWLVEGGVIVGGAVWDALSVSEQARKDLTAVTVADISDSLGKTLLDKDSSVIQQFFKTYMMSCKQITNNYKDHFEKIYKALLLHLNSQNFSEYCRSNNLEDIDLQFELLKRVAEVFGTNCVEMDFAIKSNYTSSYSDVEEAKTKLIKYGNGFPKLIYDFPDAKNVMSYFHDDQRVVNMLMNENNDRNALIANFREYLQCFKETTNDLTNFFVFVVSNNYELKYNTLKNAIPTLAANTDVLQKYQHKSPEIIKTLFDMIADGKNDFLLDNSGNELTFSEKIEILHYIGRERMEKLYMHATREEIFNFFKRRGINQGCRLYKNEGIEALKSNNIFIDFIVLLVFLSPLYFVGLLVYKIYKKIRELFKHSSSKETTDTSISKGLSTQDVNEAETKES